MGSKEIKKIMKAHISKYYSKNFSDCFIRKVYNKNIYFVTLRVNKIYGLEKLNKFFHIKSISITTLSENAKTNNNENKVLELTIKENGAN